jgi:hypothetical protein
MKTAISDFFATRMGKVTLVLLASLLCLALVAKAKKSKGLSDNPANSKLPRIASSVDGIIPERSMAQDVASSVKSVFKPFNLPSSSPPSPVEEQPRSSNKPFVPLKPLVLCYEEEAAKPRIPVEQKQPGDELPPGLLIPCRLFNGIESALPETPLIAWVISDVRVNGRVAVPKGCQIHGTVRADDQRNRVMTGTSWQIVGLGGKSMTLSGIGLTREYDAPNDRYGRKDGLAGIEGQVIKPEGQATAKFFAGTAVAAMAGLSEQRNRTVFGEDATATFGNAALEGGSAVANEYSKMKLKDLEKDRPYIRVPAGTEFYVYTQRPVVMKSPSVLGGEASTDLEQRQQILRQLSGRFQNSQ